MKKLFRFLAERHILASLITVMVIMIGFSSLLSLKRDTVPEVDLGVMVVDTVYPGASPKDVELNVTSKIEDELRGVTGIERITSVSLESFSSIEVRLDPDVEDQREVKRDVRNAVDRAQGLPEELENAPTVLEIDSSVFPIVEIGVLGDVPYSELRAAAERVETLVKDVRGVSRLEKTAFRAREVEIEVLPEKMNELQISLQAVIAAISARNVRVTGGTFESYLNERNVVALAEFGDPAQVQNVVVRTSFTGPAVTVRDLAVVTDGFEEPAAYAGMNGLTGITMTVNKTGYADIIRTVSRIRRELAEETGQPETDENGSARRRFQMGDVSVQFAGDFSRTVKDRFRITLTNGALGLGAVLLVLALFLNLRSAFWVAIGIPFTFMGVFFLLPRFDAFLDSLTLASLVLLVGIIVDDGIIIAENIVRRSRAGEPPLKAAAAGTAEVAMPVLTTILTTFLAFAPIFFMPGVLGKFVRVIPLTVTLALAVSAVEVFVALPAHMAGSLKRSGSRSGSRQKRDWSNGSHDGSGSGTDAGSGEMSGNGSGRHGLFDRVCLWYRDFIGRALRYRVAIISGFAVFLAGSGYWALNSLDFILFPSESAERASIDVELAAGSSLERTADAMQEAAAVVESLPENELSSYYWVAGQGRQLTGERFGTMEIKLTPPSKRSRDASEVTEWLTPRVGRIEAIEDFSVAVQVGGPPVGAPITLRVIGDDDASRRELVDVLTAGLEDIEGVHDIRRDDRLGKEQLEVVFDYRRLSSLGLTVADVAQTLRVAYDGQVVTSIREGDEEVDFRVTYPDSVQASRSALTALMVPNRRGRLVPLSEFSEIAVSSGPNAVYHFDGIRSTTIEAEVDQDVTTPRSATREILGTVDMEEDYPDLELRTGGEAEESIESLTSLADVFVAAVVAVYFLLVLLFGSFTQPLVIILSVPCAVAGSALAFGMHGQTPSFIAMLGVIGLVGVVVNDALVLVYRANSIRKRSPDGAVRELVAEAASDRLRPVIMTTVTTVLGLMPLAYGIGGTDYFVQPMALSLAWGLVLAVPVTLLLVPTLYTVGRSVAE